MNKKLAINTHKNKTLTRTVIRLLGENIGAEYPGGIDPGMYEYLLVGYNGKFKEIRSSANALVHHPEHELIDAATEFGKLIELLEEKEKRIENIVFACNGAAVHGIVGKGGLKLEGGASGLVTTDKIKEIYNAVMEEEGK